MEQPGIEMGTEFEKASFKKRYLFDGFGYLFERDSNRMKVFVYFLRDY